MLAVCLLTRYGMLLMTFHLIPELTIKAKIAYPRNRYVRNSTLLIQLAGIVFRSSFLVK